MKNNVPRGEMRENLHAAGSVMLLPLLGLIALLSAFAFLAALVADFFVVFSVMFGRPWFIGASVFPAATLVSIWNAVSAIEAMADPTFRKTIAAGIVLIVLIVPFVGIWVAAGEI